MTYYYYEKVLVTNCRLNGLDGYAGKMKKGSVLQLSAQLVEEEDAILAAPEGVSLMGDFYQVSFCGKVIYRIHKSGNLVRAYAADLSWVEKTIMRLPAAILALLQGKLLLKGSLLHARHWAYVLTGEQEDMSLESAAPGQAVMITERDGEYMGTIHICPDDTEVATETRALLGFFVRQDGRGQSAIEEIESQELKKKLILENIVGYELLPEELKRMAAESKIVDELSRKLYMAAMLIR